MKNQSNKKIQQLKQTLSKKPNQPKSIKQQINDVTSKKFNITQIINLDQDSQQNLRPHIQIEQKNEKIVKPAMHKKIKNTTISKRITRTQKRKYNKKKSEDSQEDIEEDQKVRYGYKKIQKNIEYLREVNKKINKQNKYDMDNLKDEQKSQLNSDQQQEKMDQRQQMIKEQPQIKNITNISHLQINNMKSEDDIQKLINEELLQIVTERKINGNMEYLIRWKSKKGVIPLDSYVKSEVLKKYELVKIIKYYENKFMSSQ